MADEDLSSAETALQRLFGRVRGAAHWQLIWGGSGVCVDDETCGDIRSKEKSSRHEKMLRRALRKGGKSKRFVSSEESVPSLWAPDPQNPASWQLGLLIPQAFSFHLLPKPPMKLSFSNVGAVIDGTVFSPQLRWSLGSRGVGCLRWQTSSSAIRLSSTIDGGAGGSAVDTNLQLRLHQLCSVGLRVIYDPFRSGVRDVQWSCDWDLQQRRTASKIGRFLNHALEYANVLLFFSYSTLKSRYRSGVLARPGEHWAVGVDTNWSLRHKTISLDAAVQYSLGAASAKDGETIAQVEESLANKRRDGSEKREVRGRCCSENRGSVAAIARYPQRDVTLRYAFPLGEWTLHCILCMRSFNAAPRCGLYFVYHSTAPLFPGSYTKEQSRSTNGLVNEPSCSQT